MVFRTSDQPAGAHRHDTAGVWVVIAAFNEASIIGEVISELLALGYRVVVVDDGSTDHTADRARKGGAVALRHAINRGQGAALQSGIHYALGRGARVLVTFDADGQHAATDVARLVAPVLQGDADAALGSRFLQHAAAVPFGRRLLLRAAVLFTRLTSGAHLTDAHNGMRALSRGAAERLDLQLDRMAHATEIVDQLLAHDQRIVEVPVQVSYTSYSRGKGQRGTAAAKIAGQYLLSKLIGR
jgi:glycosyltransferase involved in cell wall biosynthesis